MSGASFEGSMSEIEALLGELTQLREELDAEREELVVEYVDDPTSDHRADYEMMSDKARSGELGPEWQKLQRRIDLGETSLERVFAGDDDSSEADFVRSVAEEKADKMVELQQEPQSEEDYRLNYVTFAAVREEQAELMRMVKELREIPLPPVD